MDESAGRITVVIADDDPAVRALLRHWLAEAADLHILAEAADGNEALRLVQCNAVDVLLLDIAMPGTSGLDVLARMRSDAPGTRTVVVSSYPPEFFERNEGWTSASAYLHKSCATSDLLRTIRCVATRRNRAPAKPQGRP